MSDTVKLIIEISKEEYNKIKGESLFLNFATMTNAIKNGIPLDDVKAEIKKLDEGITSYEHDNPWVYKYEVLEILDNIGKGDEE